MESESYDSGHNYRRHCSESSCINKSGDCICRPSLSSECYISSYVIQWHDDVLNNLGQGISYLQIMKQLQIKCYVVIN
jgi:hypothetical protein